MTNDTIINAKLTSFNSYDQESYDQDEDKNICTNKEFVVQMFGITNDNKKVSVKLLGFKPHFYIKIGDDWKDKHVNVLIRTLNKLVLNTMKYRRPDGSMGYYEKAIQGFEIVDKKKLYGFNGGKKCRFVKIKFVNEQVMKKYRGLYYYYERRGADSVRRVKKIQCLNIETEIYEGQIPTILRLFHKKKIRPSGWVKIPLKKCRKNNIKTTDCEIELDIYYLHIISDEKNNALVPYNIASFDIEASSSHGDFPLAKKNYKKLAEDMVDVWESKPDNISETEYLNDIIETAFDLTENPLYNVNKVYPEVKLSKTLIKAKLEYLVEKEISYTRKNNEKDDYVEIDSDDEEETTTKKRSKKIENLNIIEILNETKIIREVKIQCITENLDELFPKLEGDKVTFIGTTFWRYGDKSPYLNNCIVLNSCEDLKEIKNTEIISVKTEKEVLLKWRDLIKRENPDIITGYNIFGFDYPFMFTRSKELKISGEFLKLSRNLNEICWKNKSWTSQEKVIEELKITIASGQHDLKFIKMTGRINIDMYNYFRRDYNLSSYKLDFVAGNFISDGITDIKHENNKTIIYSKNLSGLEKGSYVSFIEETHSENNYKNGQKFKVVEINKENKFFIIDNEEPLDLNKKLKWGLSKDDVTPKDIFRMTNEGPRERYKIAKYCIQDCNLVHYLMNKIDVITSYVEMASLCSVPIEYLVLRGQGIKLTSFIAKKCREKDTLMPDLDKADEDDGYEGAIVLPPKRDLYLDDPVAVNDFSSLYPSCMISENISPDSKVWTKEYNFNDELIKTTGERNDKGEFIYDNMEDYKYVDITYDTYEWRRKNNNPKSAMEKIKIGYKTCRYAQFPNNELGILPAILNECLIARKLTKKLIPKEKDEFMKNILDKRQLSIKLTGNSIYGQTGAKTSTFYEKDVAASTTAMGRTLLTYAKSIIEGCYSNTKKVINDKVLIVTAEYVYGDTDSVFFKFNILDENNNKIIGKEALMYTIELAKEAGELATKYLKAPHDLEYEKTFWPFALLSKKRYTGMLYENDVNKCKHKSMGIVLKRRDNADIVKDIYGGIIDILMKDKDIEKATDFLDKSIQKLASGEINIDKLIITKSLRGSYKNPKQIAHKVLADRIGLREPGNKPNAGDRIPYVYFKNYKKKCLQGDKIELPNYVLENDLEIDYAHYITNQIMKPVQQLFALVLEKMKEFKKIKGISLRKWYKQLEELKEKYPDSEEYEKKLDLLRNKEVESMMFSKYIQKLK